MDRCIRRTECTQVMERWADIRLTTTITDNLFEIKSSGTLSNICSFKLLMLLISQRFLSRYVNKSFFRIPQNAHKERRRIVAQIDQIVRNDGDECVRPDEWTQHRLGCLDRLRRCSDLQS